MAIEYRKRREGEEEKVQRGCSAIVVLVIFFSSGLGCLTRLRYIDVSFSANLGRFEGAEDKRGAVMERGER